VNSKQRKTLERWFTDPISGNIKWSDIESLLIALGATITEGNGSRIRVVLRDLPTVFHRPHPKLTVGKLLVKAIRQYLKDVGIENA